VVPTSTAGATGIVHQLDLRRLVPGGIDSVVDGIVRYAPADASLVVVGVDRVGDAELGVLLEMVHAGRAVSFLPVARLRTGHRRIVPETLRFAWGLLRHRRRIVNAAARLQVHRSETGAVLAAILRRLPRVQCIHGDSDVALRERPASYWRYLRRLHLWLERRSVRRASHTFVFSKSGARRLAAVAPNVTYLSTWFDPATVQPRAEPRHGAPRRALWVGRLEPEKDPLLALEAFELFVETVDRDARIVGSGSLDRELTRRAAGTSVDVPGALSRADVARAMADADVFLMTSRFEGSPVVMSEALASGTPVVCTAASDPDGRIADGANGVVVDDRSATRLAGALERALTFDRTECISSVRELAAPAVVPLLFVP
jgi:glycosyltransferase involved in cell wall biosynthesis